MSGRDPKLSSNSGVDDVEDSCDLATAVLAEIAKEPTFRGPETSAQALVGGLACVARCWALLRSMRTLAGLGQFDVLGVLMRPLFETWVLGFLLVWGDEADLERVRRHSQNNLQSLGRAGWAGLPDLGEEGANWRFADRVQRVGVVFELHGEDGSIPRATYDMVYRAESITDVHAGFESIYRHVEQDSGGGLVIVLDGGDAEQLPGLAKLKIASVLCAQLAAAVWRFGGEDGSAFDRLCTGALDP